MFPWSTTHASADLISAMRETSLAKMVRDDVLAQILRGDLRPGQRINEPDVSSRLKVSRVPVREALRELESTGLVVSKKHSGVFVRELNDKEVSDLYEMRALIDSYAGIKAAALDGPSRSALVKHMQACIARMKEEAKAANVQAYYSENLAFHWMILEATGNQALIDSYRALVQKLHLVRIKNLSKDLGMSQSIKEHERIAKAISSGNVELTRALMSDHVKDAFMRLIRSSP